MGSTGGEHDKGLDAKVGGLVWVRRRNGSWWPGKILSPDELPDGCAAIPRSGTPVKLLGKKGASVDWYNIEKSKRIKAFHCGEYEDCIEKARVSASHLSRKGVRKARREDAILHALELESALLRKDHPETPATPDLENGRGRSHANNSNLEWHSREVIEDSDMGVKVNSTESSFAEQEIAKGEPERLKTPNDSEEDVASVKRMRGLEDLGVGVPSSLKRKRSQVAHEFLKRKNRHRPLTKVLECSTMLSSPLDRFPCGNGPSDTVALNSNISRLEAEESLNSISIEIKNEADCIEFYWGSGTFSDASTQQHGPNLLCAQDDDESSQNLFEVPLMSEDMAAGLLSSVSDAPQRVEFRNGEKVDSGSTSSITAPDVQKIGLATDKSPSDWQTKGKRNSRPRKLDTDDENLYRKEAPSGSKSETIASPRSLPLRPSHYDANPKYDSADFSLRRCLSSQSCLHDVVIEVKSSYPPQHVPYISLMSKVNNRPITGHPLAIEVLEDGSWSYSNPSADPEPQTSRPKSSKSKKVGMSLKKTRKLSSLTGARGFSQAAAKKPVMQNLKSPSVACIPLKVVFSRINAALSSSYRPVPRPVETSQVKET